MTPEEFRNLKPGSMVRHAYGDVGVVVQPRVLTRSYRPAGKDGHLIQWAVPGAGAHYIEALDGRIRLLSEVMPETVKAR